LISQSRGLGDVYKRQCLFLVNQLIAPYETPTKRERIDIVGLVLLVVWVGSFQLMLDIGREHDWFASSGILALAIIAAVGLVAFVIWELTDPHPIVDLSVFRYRTLWVGTIGVSLGFGGLFSMIVLVPLWLQSVIGYTASESGHAMALVGVFAVFMAPVVGKLTQKFDVRLCITMGMLWLVAVALLRTNWSTDGDFWTFALPQLLQGFGMPFFFIGLMSFAMSSVPAKDTASAAGLLSFMRTVSGAVGTALAASWWDDASRVSRDQLAGSLNGAQDALAKLQASGLSEGQARSVIERMVDAQAATLGVNHVFWIGAGILFIAAWLPWFAPRPTGNFMAGAGGAH
jgi:DHA2 family multidrug resistance protein